MSRLWPCTREDAVEQVATTLLPQASLLQRLVAKQACWTLTRSEGSVLSTLSAAPQRITTLAELEGLAQPTVTIMVKRLEERGWVARDTRRLRRPRRARLDHRRGSRGAGVLPRAVPGLLREQMATMDDEQVAELVRATAGAGRDGRGAPRGLAGGPDTVSRVTGELRPGMGARG